MLYEDLISSIKDNGFDHVALQIYRFQSRENAVYRKFHELMDLDPDDVDRIENIPFMPVSFFKENVVKTGHWKSNEKFYSSTTGGGKPSIHYVRDLDIYEKISEQSFLISTGFQVKDYTWVALLPTYLERQNASLVYMAHHFMERSHQKSKHFHLYDHEALLDLLLNLRKEGKKTVLLGVTFALLDFAEKYKQKMDHLTIIETGGMKGRDKEPLRREVHDYLQKKLSPSAIGSEYGMTEMMSQAYMLKDEYFRCPITMRVFPREITDPLQMGKYDKSACLNIIDLGNIHTCSFLATDDVGLVKRDGRFKVMGRLEVSEVRGCSLMYA